ncbi:hypothetical protein [Frigoriflavimonas asaccharolytica]|uniref:Lipoprotein n=1 Tax=Frigoriflavimonas asaccharolytica TaxID=2735899 RepID=A0A8J8GCN4_9FLAO|nr:hypothetical protein [Frigoriflavimonas asaccharolytica]NRS94077.1 hypothetical protein [Frigoriflavimonas asaccharolytica]
MKNYIIILCFVFTSCGKIEIQSNENNKLKYDTVQNKEFVEIGNKNLPLTVFPKKWYVQADEEEISMSKKDSVNQNKMEQLDFFDEVHGKLISTDMYTMFLIDKSKNEKLDSLFLINSFSISNKEIFYVKYYKSLDDTNYDYPPKEKNIDILIFTEKKLRKRIPVYSNKSYPYAVEKKVGYLNKLGILHVKTFEIQEEGVIYVKEETIDCREYLK